MPYNAAHEVGNIWQSACTALLVLSFAFLGDLSADEAVPTTDAKPPSVSAAGDGEQSTPSADKAATPAATTPVLAPVDLLQNDLASTWRYFSSKKGVPIGDVWTVTSPGEGKSKQLNCIGEPKGFLYTQQQYSNFILTFEWQVSEANANSGVLVYTQNEPRLWPTSMQVQLHQPQAGDIFPSGDADGNATQAPPQLAKEVGSWNTCEIVSMDGQLSVTINGRKAGEVSGCKPSTGFIALQSEGTKTMFRSLLLQELPPLTVPETAEQPNELEQSATKATVPTAVKSPPAT